MLAGTMWSVHNPPQSVCTWILGVTFDYDLIVTKPHPQGPTESSPEEHSVFPQEGRIHALRMERLGFPKSLPRVQPSRVGGGESNPRLAVH